MPAILENGARIRIADNVLTFLEAADESGGAETRMEVTIAGSMQDGSVTAQPVAMLVCDIRGFSTMSEKVPPTELSQLLGVWFRELANLVQAQQRDRGQIHRRRAARLLEPRGRSDRRRQPR